MDPPRIHAGPSCVSFVLVLILVLIGFGCSGGESNPTTPAPNSPNPSTPPGLSVSVVPQAYLKASNTERSDLFGSQVALSGDTLAVGAWHESSCASGINGDQNNNGCEFAGAVYVFVRNDEGRWTQQAYLKASNPGFSNWFGVALALSGDTLAVGAPNEGSCATGVNGSPQQTGCNISGAVYVYRRTAGTWKQEAYVKPSHTDPQRMGGFFGNSVALSGDTLVVGAPYEASCAAGIDGDQTSTGCPSAGAAYVFTRSSNGWSQQTYIKAPNPEANDYFGHSVALSGDSVAVGALFEGSCTVGINGDAGNNACPYAGAVYVLRRTAGSWSHEAYVKASNTERGDQFGAAVALSGDTLAVTAAWEGSCARQINGDQHNNDCTNLSDSGQAGAVYAGGAVYVFTRHSSGWAQQAYVKPSNMDPGDRFGASLAILGDVLAVGAPAEASCATGINGDPHNNDCGTAPLTGTDSAAGAAYFYTRSADVWTPHAYVKPSNTRPQHRFGTSVALGEGTLAVGADLDASCATGLNGDQQNNRCPGAGAVYAYGTTP